MEDFSRTLTILGNGLVGSLLGICLKDLGIDVQIFEKREDPSNKKIHEGRSINLALSHRGLQTLELAGVKEKALKEAIPMKGRIIHHMDSTTSFQPYGTEGQVIYSISRSVLNNLLTRHAKEAGVSVNFASPCEEVDLKQKKIRFKVETSEKTINYNFLIGCDGAFSAMRNAMLHKDLFNYQQKYLDYGYKELSIPSLEGRHQMEMNALHIWPREDFMLIALPNLDGSFTCTLFLRYSGMNSFEKIKDEVLLHQFFSKFFPDALELMPFLNKEFFFKAPSSMVMIHCSPWNHENHSLLLGDAAHAIVPFYGQGMNAGFEDVRLFVEAIKKTNSIEQSILEISEKRKKDTDAIGELALRNFIEMRDLVDDPLFLYQKKIEGKIIKNFPHYLSLYHQVTFTDIPYSEALNNAKIQDSMFREIFSLNFEEAWEKQENWKTIETIVHKYFPNKRIV